MTGIELGWKQRINGFTFTIKKFLTLKNAGQLMEYDYDEPFSL